jgi:hypothetical protein
MRVLFAHPGMDVPQPRGKRALRGAGVGWEKTLARLTGVAAGWAGRRDRRRGHGLSTWTQCSTTDRPHRPWWDARAQLRRGSAPTAPSGRLPVTASGNGCQVVEVVEQPLLQVLVAQLLRQGEEAARVLDEVAADKRPGRAPALLSPVEASGIAVGKTSSRALRSPRPRGGGTEHLTSQGKFTSARGTGVLKVLVGLTRWRPPPARRRPRMPGKSRTGLHSTLIIRRACNASVPFALSLPPSA